MSELLRFFKDMRDNGYGLAEIAAQLGTSAIAEPVAGFAAMYDPAHGADAIREGMTYQPRTQEAQQYSQSIGNAAKTAIKPAMPIIDTWKKGVDIAGQYNPVVGAGLRTVPTAIGIAMGAKPALQAGRQVSEGLGAMQGRMIANANMPNTINNGYRNQRGVFAGINALTADKEALAKAQQMIAQGVDPAQVWKETGWGKGVDGKWRFEINDKYDITDNLDEIGSRFPIDDEITRNLISGRWNGARSTDMLSHDDLYAAYPEFKNMGIAKETGDSLGSINQDGTQAYINNTLLQRSLGGRDISKPDNAHSVLMHEIQHAIQGKEGFARGGSPQTVNQSIFRENQAKYFDDLITQLEEKLPKPNQQWIDDIHDPIEAQIEKIKEQKYNLSNSNVGFDAYRSLAGEVEARTTQSRMDLNAQQRRENYPFDYKAYGYDVPAKSQTVDFGNNKANAQRPLTEFEQAHLLAQQRAALPVNQRGLGLAPDNTAMDRARAMGWADDGYHGTSSDFPEFSLGGYGVHGNVGGTGVYLGNPDTASSYALSASSMTDKPSNVMPLLTRGKLLDTNSEAPFNNNLIDKYINENLYDGDKARIALDAGGKRTTRTFENIEDAKDFFWNQKKNWETFGGFDRTLPKVDMIDGKPVVSYVDFNAPVSLNGLPTKEVHEALRRAGGGTMTDILKNIGYDGTKSARETVIFDPKNIRSRFAAFDPFNRESSNLLAQSAKLAPTTALGAYMYNEKRKKSQGKQ